MSHNILDEEQITTTSNAWPVSHLIPVGIALVGVILSTIALFVGLSKKAEAPHVWSDDQLTQLQNRLTQAESQLIQLADESHQNADQIKALADQTQRALDTIGKEFIKIKKAPQAAAPTTRSSAETPSSTPESTRYTQHMITQNETLSKIAHQYGISVQTIMALNPDVNPNRLRIGQKIKVPAR